MKELSNADKFQIEAAEGWLMLGNPVEANEELEKISPENRRHPAALSVRWQVYATAEWWEALWSGSTREWPAYIMFASMRACEDWASAPQ